MVTTTTSEIETGYYTVDLLNILLHLSILFILYCKWDIQNSSFISLLFHFHGVIFAESITLIPNLYSGNVILCQINQFMQIYFSIQVTGCIYFFFEKVHRRLDSTTIQVSLTAWYTMHIAILLFPLFFIFFLFTPGGISSNSMDNDNFCTLPYHHARYQVGLCYYLPIAILLCFIIRYFIQFCWKILRNTWDFQLLSHFMSNGGWFLLLLLIQWIPKFFTIWFPPNPQHNNTYILYFIIIVINVCYGIHFFLYQKQLKDLEKIYSVNSNVLSLRDSTVFGMMSHNFSSYTNDSDCESITQKKSQQQQRGGGGGGGDSRHSSSFLSSLSFSRTTATNNHNNNPSESDGRISFTNNPIKQQQPHDQQQWRNSQNDKNSRAVEDSLL